MYKQTKIKQSVKKSGSIESASDRYGFTHSLPKLICNNLNYAINSWNLLNEFKLLKKGLNRTFVSGLCLQMTFWE